ncbi:hypothetical protein TIFTF001_016679 [Ficus carica]|uniref:Uncharacterized protein n=1 Tax=Ficus carica TaxID=3494 RepID=A0AA88AP90_FICCA|nr:hypothetical protein TIFTF001_016679 [Ficus carica]
MEVCAPYLRERVDNPCKGWFTIYEIVFLLGLTFPMPRLASAMLVGPTNAELVEHQSQHSSTCRSKGPNCG